MKPSRILALSALFAVTGCGGKIVLDPGPPVEPASVQTCVKACDFANSCQFASGPTGVVTPSCTVNCPAWVELSTTANCVTAYNAWVNCASESTTCLDYDCASSDERWLACIHAFCSPPPPVPPGTAMACFLALPCDTDAECDGLVCSMATVAESGTGTCVNGTPGGAGGAGGTGGSP